MKLMLILLVVLLTGCSSRPVRFAATLLGGMGKGLSHEGEMICHSASGGATTQVLRCK